MAKKTRTDGKGITFWVKTEQYPAIALAAAMHGMSVAEYCRGPVLEQAETDLSDDAVTEHLESVRDSLSQDEFTEEPVEA